jgi:hypothetical protein
VNIDAHAGDGQHPSPEQLCQQLHQKISPDHGAEPIAEKYHTLASCFHGAWHVSALATVIQGQFTYP